MHIHVHVQVDPQLALLQHGMSDSSLIMMSQESGTGLLT